MLSSANSPTFRRVSLFVNAAVILSVSVGVLLGFNWGRIPHSLESFVALQISVKTLLLGMICLGGAASSMYLFGLTKPWLGTTLSQELVKVTKACTVGAIFLFLLPLPGGREGAGGWRFFSFLPIAIAACFVGRLIGRSCAQWLSARLHGRRNLIIVGSGPRAESFYHRVRGSNHHEFSILGFVDSPDQHHVNAEMQQQMLGSLEDLEGVLMRQPVDQVLIALPVKSCHEQIQTVIMACERAGVEAKYLLDIFELSLARPSFDPHENECVVSLKVVRDDSHLLVKRGIDILGAVVGLLFFGPFMLTIAAAIRLTSPGPALFVQERVGLRKRHFRMYKFRTMVNDAESLQSKLELQQQDRMGPGFKMRNDPRITRLGRFLRRTSLDECPQFFNVLRGEMSLVGPRPLTLRDVACISDGALMRRYSVKPGLTCLWQINGRSNINFDRWIELDLRYIDTWSLGLDLQILAKTFTAVLAGKGAM